MPGLPGDYPRPGATVHEISTFDFQSSAVRIIDQNGEPWFVGKDICDALAHTNSNKALARLDDDERATVELPDALGRMQPTTIISQAGVWRLGLTSRVPAARAFQRNLVHEILPQWYRDHTSRPASPPPLPSSPDALSRALTEMAEDAIASALDSGAPADVIARLTAWRGRLAAGQLSSGGPPLNRALDAADEALAAARDAGYPAAYIARLARWRAQVALGKNVAAPRLPRQPQRAQLALPAPSLEDEVVTARFQAAAVVPDHMVHVMMSPQLLRGLYQRDEATRRLLTALLLDCIERPGNLDATVN